MRSRETATSTLMSCAQLDVSEPCWRDWLRSEVADSQSAGYPAGWVTGTCASAGTDVL
jgi:hypothetical protein